jgi:hypothetical protein
MPAESSNADFPCLWDAQVCNESVQQGTAVDRRQLHAQLSSHLSCQNHQVLATHHTCPQAAK